MSTNTRILEPARARENLTIIGDALVGTVLFEGRKATGVRARVAGPRRSSNARTVVLAAGAIFSPAILLRSGVGPFEEVRRLGASLVSERPGVGRLFDHPLLTVTFRLKEEYRAPAPAPRDFFSSILLLWTSDTPHSLKNDLNVHTQSFIGTSPEARETGGLVLGLGAVYSAGKVEVESPGPGLLPLRERGDALRQERSCPGPPGSASSLRARAGRTHEGSD